MTGARYLIGDVFDRLAEIPDNSVDLVLTSPPFLALRSYLPADHPDKAKEIGSEPTPEAFIDTLLDLTEEWARVLAPHGSIAVELGDTYSGSGNDGGPQGNGISGNGGARWRDRLAGNINDQPRKGSGWPLPKSLCLIPESYRWALVYGRNPFNGRTTPPWRARNVIRWCRPNPPVGALGDKFRPATSEMVVACKSGSRYFDLDAVRTEHSVSNGGPLRGRAAQPKGMNSDAGSEWESGERLTLNPAGAPPLDWWEIPTQPYKGAHYATWPEALCVRPIEAMCPRRVCRTCGKPSERITQRSRESSNNGAGGKGRNGREVSDLEYFVETLGWSDCGHNTWRPGMILDPFAGSGTSLAVATGHGRDAIGIDLDARNAELARERVGMFLEIEYPTEEVTA